MKLQTIPFWKFYSKNQLSIALGILYTRDPYCKEVIVYELYIDLILIKIEIWWEKKKSKSLQLAEKKAEELFRKNNRGVAS